MPRASTRTPGRRAQPLLVITKHPLTYDGLNPSFQVTVRAPTCSSAGPLDDPFRASDKEFESIIKSIRIPKMDCVAVANQC